jgi:hypothetical protein
VVEKEEWGKARSESGLSSRRSVLAITRENEVALAGMGRLAAMISMGKPAGSFTVALGSELKVRLLDAARAAGTSPAVITRRALEQALRDDAPKARVSRQAPAGEPIEIRLRVTAGVAAQLAAAAREAGMTRTAYVSTAAAELAERSAARGGRAPRAPGLEVVGALREALAMSNANLAPIGRNLNQVARALNTHPGHMSSADREELTRVVRRLCEHLKISSQLLHAIRAPRNRSER